MSSKSTFGFFVAGLLLLLPLIHQTTADCLWEEKVIIVIIKVIKVIIKVIKVTKVIGERERRKS